MAHFYKPAFAWKNKKTDVSLKNVLTDCFATLHRADKTLLTICFILGTIVGFTQESADARWKAELLSNRNRTKEVVALRDRVSKHFMLSDGKYQAIITGGRSFHYQDKHGKWQDIDLA